MVACCGHYYDGLFLALPVEKTLPRKTTVNTIASGGYNYATNANQVDIDIIADSIDSQNANLLILVPAGRTEDTVALLGPSAVRYATLDTSSFDAVNGSITYRGCSGGSRRRRDTRQAARRGRNLLNLRQ